MERLEWLEFIEKRYNRSVPDSWFTAYLLCPLYFGEDLTENERKPAIDWIKMKHPECNSEVFKFIGENLPVLKFEFQEYTDKKK